MFNEKTKGMYQAENCHRILATFQPHAQSPRSARTAHAGRRQPQLRGAAVRRAGGDDRFSVRASALGIEGAVAADTGLVHTVIGKSRYR